MTGGPDLADTPLARAVLARWSWRPAGARGAQGLLGDLAERRSPMLEHAQGLRAWHENLAHRWWPWSGWQPLDTARPARATAGGGPLAPGALAAPPAPDDGATMARGSFEPGEVPTRGAEGRSRAAPVRITPVSGAGPRVQRLPAAAPAPTRPALTLTALAAPAATSAPPLPVPFRPTTPAAAADPATGGPMLVPAIGRRFARREVAGGFPEAPARGPAGDRETSAARPMTPPVRWRVVDGRPADDAHRRPDAGPQASDGDGNRPTAPALPAPWAERPFPIHRTEPAPDRRTHGAGLAERLGASGPIPLPGLSVRVVPPEEAARRLALGDKANGRRDEAPGARSEAGARREGPPSPPQPAIDIDALVERVQRELQRRERFERERKGLY